MSHEAGVVVGPIGGNTYGLPVESGTGGRIQRPYKPITEKNCGERNPKPLLSNVAEQKKKNVTKPDLRERIFKSEVGSRLVHGAQEKSQNDEKKGAPDGVAKLIAEAFAFGGEAGDGVRQR